MAVEKIRVLTNKKVLKQVEKAPPEVEDAFFDGIEKIQGMTWVEAMADNGLEFERDQKRKKINGWSFRINQGWRALFFKTDGSVIEVYGIRNPTAAHSTRRR